MTARGLTFLEAWIEKNLPAGEPHDPMRASDLAKRCIIEAAAEGIPLKELQPDSGSLESYIADVLLHRLESGTPGE